jgi:glycopeptide antibiotics resistance protein
MERIKSRIALFALSMCFMALILLMPRSDAMLPQGQGVIAEGIRYVLSPSQSFDRLSNFFLYIPLFALMTRISHVRSRLLIAMLCGFFSIFFELAQQVIPGRFCSSLDVLLNVLGISVAFVTSKILAITRVNFRKANVNV